MINVKVRKLTRLGNQQPSHQNGGRFNDHPQGVGSSDPKRTASERMMIWSGLMGNHEQVDKTGRGLTTHAEHNDYIGGFAITHNWGDTGETNTRIVKWDSAG
jgi:hypothetical protein